MLKLQQLLLIIFLFNTPVFGQNNWQWSNPSPSGYDCIDIHFLSRDTGFILNTHEILSTTDCGNHWTKLKDIPSPKAFSFKNSSGYIVGNSGYIARSIDGGKSWNKIQSTISEDLNSVTVISQDTIFVSGLRNLYRSVDAGKSWQMSEITNKTKVNKTVFLNAQVGHAVCYGAILKTKDGGKNWYATDSNNTSSDHYVTLHFITPQIGYATRVFNNLYKTTNGGESWKLIYASEFLANAIYFADTNTGFIAGKEGMIVKTINGGKTWTSMTSDLRTGNDLNALHFIDTTTGFAIGPNGRIMKTTDGGVRWNPYSPTYHPNSDISFPSDTIGYSGGFMGTLIKSTNSGKSWNKITSPTSDYIGCIHFFNNDTGIIGGGGLWKTYNAGQTWKPILLPNRTAHSISFINDSVGFISGSDNGQSPFIAKTSNAGETWNIISNQSINEIVFLNQYIGHGLYQGTLHRTTDGGITWKPFKINSPGTDDYFASFDFRDPNWGYVVGLFGTAYKTLDGGNSWITQTLPYNDYEAVKFLNKNIGYICAKNGSSYVISVFKTLNGGNSWHPQSIPELSGPYVGFSNIFITPNNHIYITGANGFILKDSVSTDTVSTAVSTVFEKNNEISIYPNPTNNILNIRSDKVPYKMDLINSNGQIVTSVTQQRTLNISDIENGLYFIRIYFDDKIIFRKIIKY